DRHSSYAVHFAAGFDEAVARHAMSGAWRAVEPGFDSVSAAVRSLLADHPETTGLVVHNEGALTAVLATLRTSGLRVPQDMSVVVVAPDDMARNHSVELSGVAVPAEEMGLRAVDLVLDQLDGVK